jgi:hypothetical protein
MFGLDNVDTILIIIALIILGFLVGYAVGHHKGVACGRRLEEKSHVNNDY